MTDHQLIELATEAAASAYAPYSKAFVGAVVAAASGARYLGCNVENASYGLTICAERNAIFAGVAAEGPDFRIRQVGVVAAGLEFPPCGACRQVIAEFADADATVCFLRAGKVITMTMRELLPASFEFSAPHAP